MNSREKHNLRINEIFGPTIQGEGALIGQPTVFVRTGGCDYRCSWCDTLHAVDSEYRHEWHSMSVNAIWQKISEISGHVPLVVSLSGGNPATQPLGELIELGHEYGYRFALETQGSIAKDWFQRLDVLTLSPKPPSSGMDTNWGQFDKCLVAAGNGPDIALKIVVFCDADYIYARETARRYPHIPVYLQPGNHTPPQPDDSDATLDLAGIQDRFDWLISKVINDRWFEVTVLPQLHVLLWGNKRGV